MSGRLHVAIDATAIPADRGGVGRYVDSLVAHLAVLDVTLTIICQGRDEQAYAALAPGAGVVRAPAAVQNRLVRLAWEQLGLPFVLRRLGADVVHSPHYTMPGRGPYARVVTVHDATFFSDPGLHSRAKVRLFSAAIRRAVRSDATIVAVSRATADEIARYTGCSSDRFAAIHHGVDPTVFHPVDAAERARVRSTLALDGERPYIAFLGTLEPRKNVPSLIRGWVRAVRDLDPSPALVLAGARGWDPEVDSAIAAVPDGLTVIRAGYVPLDDLAGLLAGAAVVAYPSLGEGFGLPVLEAMACGAPVLTTRLLALPEVGGDAVAYTGTSEAEIAASLRELLDDEQRCAALRTAASSRAALFTWRAAALAHLETYRQAARAHGTTGV